MLGFCDIVGLRATPAIVGAAESALQLAKVTRADGIFAHQFSLKSPDKLLLSKVVRTQLTGVGLLETKGGQARVRFELPAGRPIVHKALLKRAQDALSFK